MSKGTLISDVLIDMSARRVFGFFCFAICKVEEKNYIKQHFQISSCMTLASWYIIHNFPIAVQYSDVRNAKWKIGWILNTFFISAQNLRTRQSVFLSACTEIFILFYFWGISLIWLRHWCELTLKAWRWRNGTVHAKMPHDKQAQK